MFLTKLSKKILSIFFLGIGVWLLLGISQVEAASITLSPPKFEFSAEKGGSIAEVITITNGEDTELTLEISVADFSASGELGKAQFTEGEANDGFSISSWIQLNSQTVVVPANEKVTVPFVVQVPENAEAGGHFGTIFFSPVVAPQGDVSIRQKVGTLLLVRVAGEVIEQGELDIFAPYKTSITGENLTLAKKKAIFSQFPINLGVRFSNTGNVHTKPQGSIQIKNMFGKDVARVGEELILNSAGAVTGTRLVDYIPVNDEAGNVLPNNSRAFMQEWKGYGSEIINNEQKRVIRWQGTGLGRYSAQLNLSYGSTELPAQVIHFWIIPWMILLPGLGGLVVLMALIMFWRRTSRERLKKKLRMEIEGEHAYTQPEQDTTHTHEDLN
jgi:hypothetical protein